MFLYGDEQATFVIYSLRFVVNRYLRSSYQIHLPESSFSLIVAMEE